MEEKNCKFPFSIRFILEKKCNDSDKNISFQYFLLLLITFMILQYDDDDAWLLPFHHYSLVIKNANFTFILWFFKYSLGDKKNMKRNFCIY